MRSTEAGSVQPQGIPDDARTVGRHARNRVVLAVVPAIIAHRKSVHRDIDKREKENPESPVDGGFVRKGLNRLGRMVRREVEVVKRIGEADLPGTLFEEAIEGAIEGVEHVLFDKIHGKISSRRSVSSDGLEPDREDW